MSSPVNTLTTHSWPGHCRADSLFWFRFAYQVVTVINLAIVSAYLIWYAKTHKSTPERYEAAFAGDSTSEDEAPKYEPLKSKMRSVFLHCSSVPLSSLQLAVLPLVLTTLPLVLSCFLLVLSAVFLPVMTSIH